MNLKRILFVLLLCMFAAVAFPQTDTTRKKDTTARVKKDSTTSNRDTVKQRRDTARPRRDTLLPRRDTTPRPVIVAPTIAPPVQRDTSTIPADTVAAPDTVVLAPPLIYVDTTSYFAYMRHPYIGFNNTPVFMLMKERVPESKDRIFYLLMGLLFFVAFTRILFPKYFQNTFRLFFQSSFRQKQTRDQLLQQNLGSLLLNLLFFFSAAVYLTLVLDFYEWNLFPFWKLLLYSLLMVAALYVGKFIFLSFAGWVFNAKEGAETYIFIVFLINKIIGVILIPFILVIAFADDALTHAAITASVILLVLLFVYRYFVSLQSFRRDLHINPFQFFLYLCGVEIVPLLVIGKAIFNYVDGRF